MINTKDNIVNIISEISEDDTDTIDLNLYLVSKARATDELYHAKKKDIHPEVIKDIKCGLKKSLNKIKHEIDGDSIGCLSLPECRRIL